MEFSKIGWNCARRAAEKNLNLKPPSNTKEDSACSETGEHKQKRIHHKVTKGTKEGNKVYLILRPPDSIQVAAEKKKNLKPRRAPRKKKEHEEKKINNKPPENGKNERNEVFKITVTTVTTFRRR